MSKSEKLNNYPFEEGSSTYGYIIPIFYGHKGGGKITEPPENPPKLDTSAIPPSRGDHRGSSTNMPNKNADGKND